MPRKVPHRAVLLFPCYLCYWFAYLAGAASKESQGHLAINSEKSRPITNPAVSALLSCYNANISSEPTTFDEFKSGKPTRSLRLERVWWSQRDAGFPLTVFTQIDLGRLKVLALQCRSYPGGVLAAAIWVPLFQPPGANVSLMQQNQDAVRKAGSAVDGLFNEMEGLNTVAGAGGAANTSSGAAAGPGGFRACSLRLLVFSELLDEEALTVLLPINALRNAAMLAADTPLSAMLDVDLSMSQGLAGHLMGNETRAAEVVRRAEQDHVLWVMPAWDTNRTLGYHNWNTLLNHMISLPPEAKTTQLKAAWQTKADLYPFAFDRYIRGHNATDFPRWVTTDTDYPIAYARGYEPWFIMARKATPYYDARFRGYYFNKLLNVRNFALHNASFWVLSDVWLVHRNHEITVSSNVWYKIRQKDKAAFSAVFDKPLQPTSPDGRTFRDVFNERSRSFYLNAMEQMDAGTYVPVLDTASQHCRQVLPWWK